MSKSLLKWDSFRKLPSSARPAGRCFPAWHHAFILLFFRICMISENSQRSVKTPKPNSIPSPMNHLSKGRSHDSGFCSLCSMLLRFLKLTQRLTVADTGDLLCGSSAHRYYPSYCFSGEKFTPAILCFSGTGFEPFARKVFPAFDRDSS